MKRCKWHSILLLGLVLLLAGLVTACSATPASAPPTQPPQLHHPPQSPTPQPSRPPLHIGETIYSHDFAFTPTELGYTSILICGPFKGNTFDAFKPIEGYDFFYLKMLVTNQGIERAEPPIYGRDGQFKVKVDKGYIYQEVNQITSLSWANERWIGQADFEQRRAYPYSNRLIFELNPEEDEELVVVFEILRDTKPTEITFRLFASPEFASQYGVETITIPLSNTTLNRNLTSLVSEAT